MKPDTCHVCAGYWKNGVLESKKMFWKGIIALKVLLVWIWIQKRYLIYPFPYSSSKISILMNTRFHGIFFVKFLLNLIFKNFPKIVRHKIHLQCSRNKHTTKNQKQWAVRNEISKTEIGHGSTFCTTLQFSLNYFLSKKNNYTWSAQEFWNFPPKI